MMIVNRIGGAIGAEISGLDLAVASDVAIAALRSAWLEHGVVVVLNQGHLTPAQYLGFARRIGTPIEYPFVRGLAEFPEIIEVKKLEHERVNFGGIWHTDTAYLERPPMASMLLALEIPPYGGDTEFASLTAAYNALSDGMKALLAPLQAVNSSANADVSKTREDRIKSDGREADRKVYEAVHPVVRVHPETGKKALYVNMAHTARFEGMTDEESASILKFLFAHSVRAEFTCRVRWAVGSLALWDNRAALHNPVNDYHGFRRVMQRITLAGDKPSGSHEN